MRLERGWSPEGPCADARLCPDKAAQGSRTFLFTTAPDHGPCPHQSIFPVEPGGRGGRGERRLRLVPRPPSPALPFRDREARSPRGELPPADASAESQWPRRPPEQRAPVTRPPAAAAAPGSAGSPRAERPGGGMTQPGIPAGGVPSQVGAQRAGAGPAASSGRHWRDPPRRGAERARPGCTTRRAWAGEGGKSTPRGRRAWSGQGGTPPARSFPGETRAFSRIAPESIGAGGGSFEPPWERCNSPLEAEPGP